MELSFLVFFRPRRVFSSSPRIWWTFLQHSWRCKQSPGLHIFATGSKTLVFVGVFRWCLLFLWTFICHDGFGLNGSTVYSWGGIVLATETVDVSNWNILQSVMIFSWSNSWGLYGWKLCWMGGIWKISISIVEHDCSLASLHNRFSMLFQQQSYSLDVDSCQPTNILLGIFEIYETFVKTHWIPHLSRSHPWLDSITFSKWWQIGFFRKQSCLPFKSSFFWGSKSLFQAPKTNMSPLKRWHLNQAFYGTFVRFRGGALDLRRSVICDGCTMCHGETFKGDIR